MVGERQSCRAGSGWASPASGGWVGVFQGDGKSRDTVASRCHPEPLLQAQIHLHLQASHLGWFCHHPAYLTAKLRRSVMLSMARITQVKRDWAAALGV